MDNISSTVKKTSKFIDNFIRVITVVSFCLFALSFYVYYYQADELYQNQLDLCDSVWSQGQTQQNPLENPIQSAFLDFKNNCFNNAARTADMWGKTAFIALDITILLPLVYFGGKRVVSNSADKIKRVNTTM